MKPLFKSISLLLGMVIIGCIIPYSSTNQTKVQECDAYGKHWIYKEHFTGHGGLAVVAGHGGVTTSSINTTKTIQELGADPLNVIDRISIIQSTGQFKHYEFKKKELRSFNVFILDNRIFIVLREHPEAITDAAISMPSWYQGSKSQDIELLGEWDPLLLEFRIDRYFPQEQYLFSIPLSQAHLQKASKFGLNH